MIDKADGDEEKHKIPITLVRSEPVKPQETQQILPKMFCASRNYARELLHRIMLMLGALREVETVGVSETELKALVVRLQEFLSDIGEKLMLDTGLTENDIDDIAREIRGELKKP